MASSEEKDDITRMRAALREAESRLKACGAKLEQRAEARRLTDRLFGAIFDAAPEAMGLTRLRDGQVVDVNPEWEAVSGWSRAEAVGRTTIELGLWADQSQREPAVAQLRSTGRLRDMDVLVTGKDGAKRMMRLNGALLNVDEEAHILMYMKDITAERMAEEGLHAGEQALAQANERLNAQLQLYDLTETVARIGHWIASADGETVKFSKGLQRLAGHVMGEVGTKSQGRSRIHPDDLPAFLAARKAMDGRMLEYRWLHPDGVTRWLRSSMINHTNLDGSVNGFGVVMDVTPEHEAAQALRDKLDFIEKLTSRVPDVLFQYQRLPSGAIVLPFVSESAEKLFGVPAAKLRHDARQLFSMIDPEDKPGLFEAMRAAHHDGGSFEYEFRIHRAVGDVRWVRANSITALESNGELVSYGAVRDFTESRLAQERIEESEARFRSLTDLSSDWYWEIDANFRFTRFDGYRDAKSIMTMEESIGKTRWELGALNLGPLEWEEHRKVLESHQPFRDLELQRLDATGQSYWVAVSGTPIIDAQGGFHGYRGIGRDISTRKRAEDETQRLAFYDTLTGLPNRRLLMDRLAHAQVTSARSRRHGALLFIDLDNFKDLNDTLGHDVGDQLLEQVSLRLVTCIREVDTAARFGGDEFVVMLEDLSETDHEAANQAESVAEKVLARLNSPYELVGRQHNSSPSIGITLFCGSTHSADELLKRADVAMYQAKAAGRNTMRFYDPEMQAAVLARAALDADLRQGLSRGEFMLHYQPIVDGKQRTVAYEALLRWQHPERGLVSPGEFIALAEQSGQILGIGEWVLRTACAQLVAWGAQARTADLSLAVNVSTRQFRHPDFVTLVLSILEETGASPQLLKLELTESVLISDVEDAILKMEALRARGVRFALDDFGTGYSSLSYLKRLPLDQLKIDQSFVRDVLSDPNDAAIVRTILALAQSMDLLALAEGVETEGQRQFLLDCGCTLFQGYLFGRPSLLPPDEASPG